MARPSIPAPFQTRVDEPVLIVLERMKIGAKNSFHFTLKTQNNKELHKKNLQ